MERGKCVRWVFLQRASHRERTSFSYLGKVFVFVLCGLLVGACNDKSTESDSRIPTKGNDVVSANDPSSEGCRSSLTEAPLQGPQSFGTVLVRNGSLVATAYLAPRPDYEGNPWSQWGQGVVLPGGRFLSAFGDHLGVDGNSYFQVWDPSTRALARVADVRSAVQHERGEWGYGKIHARMVLDKCGIVYASTYWGTRRNLVFGTSYRGDRILRIDPATFEITDLGTPVDAHGVPSLAGDPRTGLLFGEAVDPGSSPDGGPFFVYDMEAEKVVQEVGNLPHAGFRAILIDGRGRAWFSAGDKDVHIYDPASGKITTRRDVLPGPVLRSATGPGPDGTVYGVTNETFTLFSVDMEGEVKSIAALRGDAASIALDPSGDRVFYVPHAHGRAWEEGTPLIAVDTRSGEERVLALLNTAAEERIGLRLGGTYNVAVAPTGDRLFIGFNAAPPESGKVFGEVVLVVVELSS